MMRCPTCEQPTRIFLVDGMPVHVESHPGLGTLQRRSVIDNSATEHDPFPGGWVRHVCRAA